MITALEKFHWENTAVARWVKVELDRRLGCSWHAVVGEQFSCDTTYEVANCRVKEYFNFLLLKKMKKDSLALLS